MNSITASTTVVSASTVPASHEHAIVQHPTDLALCVLRPPDYTGIPPLTVFTSKSLYVRNWRFTFHIIGESHWVQVERDHQILLHEVLACTDGLPSIHRFSDGAGYCSKGSFKGDPHAVCVQFDPPRAWERDADKYTGEMVYEFPRTFGLLPMTRIAWRVDPAGDSVIWRTSHLYAVSENSGMIEVRSVSRYRIGRNA
jgi:hypothetical protein